MLLAVAAPLYGDPVTVTSGLVRAEVQLLGAGFLLEGADFSWMSTGHFLAPVAAECSYCPSGTRTTLDGRLSVSSLSGPLVWNGVNYGETVDVIGRGFFTTGEVVVSGSGEFTLTTPFQFEGVFDVFPHLSNDRLFTMNLAGSGTAVGLFGGLVDEPGLHLARSVQYTFDAQPAPVPEPASFVLIGSGLVGLALRRRRRGARAEAR